MYFVELAQEAIDTQFLSRPQTRPSPEPKSKPVAVVDLKKKVNLLGGNKRLGAYLGASALHALAAAENIFSDPEKPSTKLSKIALLASNITHTIVYGKLSHQAFTKNRIFDAISKILDPLLSWLVPASEINMAKGIGSGIGLIDYGLAGRARTDQGKKTNFIESFKNWKTMMKEIFDHGLGDNRKIFRNKEEGHTLLLSGSIISLCSIISLMFKPLNKISTFVRNSASIISNTVTMYHPDNDKKVTGTIFNVYSVIDTLQKFTTGKLKDALNDIDMMLYNIGIFIYGGLSNKRDKGAFQHYLPSPQEKAALA